MLKDSYTVKELLLAIGCAALAISCWTLGRSYETNHFTWQRPFQAQVLLGLLTIFFLNLAIGLMNSKRPMRFALIMVGVLLAGIGVLLIISLPLSCIANR